MCSVALVIRVKSEVHLQSDWESSFVGQVRAHIRNLTAQSFIEISLKPSQVLRAVYSKIEIDIQLITKTTKLNR